MIATVKCYMKCYINGDNVMARQAAQRYLAVNNQFSIIIVTHLTLDVVS